jgi:ribosomal protein L39E
MSMYCIPNAPKQNGDLWVVVKDNVVTVLNPAGEYWRNKTFTIEQFKRELNISLASP